MLTREDARQRRSHGVHDGVEHRERQVRHLSEIVEEGESEWTPVILGAGVLLIVIPIVALTMAVCFAVYFWA